MSVYRRNYKIKGEKHQSRYFTVEFRAPDGSLVRRSTKCTNRRAAEAAELDIRKQIESGHVGIADPTEARRPVTEHIKEYIEHLNGLKRSKDYCRIAGSRLTLMAKEAGWRRLQDITLASFEAWRRDQASVTRSGRTPKPKTVNQFLDTARAFLGWCEQHGRIKVNPLLKAPKANAPDTRNYRRAGNPEEFGKLLAAATPDRQRFYRWAIFVPLRRRTHGELEWSDVHEADERPWVGIRPETIKDKKYVPLPLRKDVAEMMAKWRAEVKPKPHDKVFPEVPSLKEIRADLTAAGVTFADSKGLNRLDLHAFRKTAVRWMKQAGVPIEDAAAILQHRDIRTTKRYYDEEPDTMSMDVVERMPGLPDGGIK